MGWARLGGGQGFCGGGGLGWDWWSVVVVGLDDLMVFCKGEFQSCYLMLQGLKLFEETSGLVANKNKSELYQANMRHDHVDKLCRISGFSAGKWPFKYLGALINHRRIAVVDYDKLVEKLIVRIRSWQSRNISFAGRLQLVNFVLMSICTYWLQIMILPKKVISAVNKICRDYLWYGNTKVLYGGYVNWSKVCTLKKHGGLGVRDLLGCNYVAVGKYVWHISGKRDNLWVKWVHVVYIKEKNWWDYIPPQNSSWAWRFICATKEKMKDLPPSCWQPARGTYSISAIYKNIKDQEGAAVYWDNVVWNRPAMPKHKFFFWLVVMQRLRVKDRLHRFNICNNDLCCICNVHPETHDHLFLHCHFSNGVWEGVLSWVSVQKR